MYQIRMASAIAAVLLFVAAEARAEGAWLEWRRLSSIAARMDEWSIEGSFDTREACQTHLLLYVAGLEKFETERGTQITSAFPQKYTVLIGR